jgi:hypothetical protein
VCRRVFDTATFKSDLKEVLRTAGIEGTPVLLSLEERHLATDTGRQSRARGRITTLAAHFGDNNPTMMFVRVMSRAPTLGHDSLLTAT